MKTFEVWNRIALDGKAPGTVNLAKDYKLLGSVAADTPREVANKLTVGTKDDLDLTEVRPPAVGDVLKSSSGEAWILTPERLWALVKTEN